MKVICYCCGSRPSCTLHRPLVQAWVTCAPMPLLSVSGSVSTRLAGVASSRRARRPTPCRRLASSALTASSTSRLGLKACVRLNGTSDIDWARITAYRASLFDRWSNVQFYDYTKSFSRMMEFLFVKDYPKNYHLTFSRSELNDDQCDTILRHGGNVAVVFDSVPDSFRGRPVYNGDDSDLRFLDPKGVWIGLKAKGKLRQNASTFKADALTACN